jgi:hypothetical protein
MYSAQNVSLGPEGSIHDIFLPLSSGAQVWHLNLIIACVTSNALLSAIIYQWWGAAGVEPQTSEY